MRRLWVPLVLALAIACQSRYSERKAAPRAPAREFRLDQPVSTLTESRDDSAALRIIRTGQVSIEVDSIDPAVTRVTNLAKAFGGYIGSSSIERGAENVKTATLVIDVPEERLDGVIGQLNPIGRVESVNMTARDVGEEYVDFESRVANSRREEQQLAVLLANRTGKLKDVLDVERELALVQGEIEHYEGHLRYLKAHATMSSLDITVHEHPTVLADAPGEHPLRDAMGQAWRNFIGFVAFGIASLGVLLPVGALGGGAGVIWAYIGRPWANSRKNSAKN